jgi:hypothetical protein
MDTPYPIAAHARAGMRSMRRGFRPAPQRAALGAVILALSMLAVLSGAAVGAQTTYPPGTVVSTYIDLRYCGGPISIVADSGGNLINVCTATGQRIIPAYPDNGYLAGFAGAGYVPPGYVPPAATTQYIVPSVANPYPYANGAYLNGAYPNGAYLNTTGCGFNGGNCGALPAGGTQVGNVIYYTDNRYCGDGQVALVLGQGYFCQNGNAFVQNG